MSYKKRYTYRIWVQGGYKMAQGGYWVGAGRWPVYLVGSWIPLLGEYKFDATVM